MDSSSETTSGTRAGRLAFWHELASALRSGPVFLALVVESTAHSPGTAGARLFVTAEASRGTVGGGVMEKRLIERGRDLLRRDESLLDLVDLHHRRQLDRETGERSGMVCAGRQTNLYATLDPDRDLGSVETWLACLEAERGALYFDAHGLRVEADAELDHERRLHRDDEAWSYEESALERRRLAILGGGHCGQALARVMSRLGWRVRVFETRPSIVAGAGLEGAVLVDDFRLAGERISHPELTPVVVMTTDVPNDVRALVGVLASGRPFPFIGAMASRAKLEEIHRRLLAEGVGEEHLARLTAPVGLPIGSDTPEEIAVSVAAQLLEKRGEWLETGEA